MAAGRRRAAVLEAVDRVLLEERAPVAARAVDRPDLAAVRRQTEATLRAQVAQAIVNGKECGETLADTDGESAAVGLLALVEGLGLHLYLDADLPASVALLELDRALENVLPGECRRYA